MSKAHAEPNESPAVASEICEKDGPALYKKFVQLIALLKERLSHCQKHRSFDIGGSHEQISTENPPHPIYEVAFQLEQFLRSHEFPVSVPTTECWLTVEECSVLNSLNEALQTILSEIEKFTSCDRAVMERIYSEMKVVREKIAGAVIKMKDSSLRATQLHAAQRNIDTWKHDESDLQCRMKRTITRQQSLKPDEMQGMLCQLNHLLENES